MPTQKWGSEFRYLLTSKPVTLPIPHGGRNAQQADQTEERPERSHSKRLKPSDSDLVKAYFFMIKEVLKNFSIVHQLTNLKRYEAFA